MVKWIVLAAVLLGLFVLALAARRVLTRLPRLRRAALALQGRQEQAENLQRVATTLQQRAEELQQQIETVQRRVEVIQSRRGKRA
ncbi:hypothetical protein [Plantactinospora sonchi]|uniref:DNA recombination protein RmuC n=1 Tax=Plantactinospora sonchi TaxID=1544735 RepID=A0ABU7RTV7_9ACTN